MITDELVFAGLDAIERYEAAFLAWGLIDQSSTRSELDEVLRDASLADREATLDELVRRSLVVEVPRSHPPRFRSRMAEAVRLFTTLRQQFERRSWSSANRLVADFRFVVRPRRFPRRVHELDAVVGALGGEELPRNAIRALNALLGVSGSDGSRKLSSFQVAASAEVLRGLATPSDRACIVTAGTGSGKTLAFYLPALIHLVAGTSVGSGAGVLAVYPRNELLKDQLLATMREVRRLRAADSTLPEIRIGAYFGPTPFGDPKQPPQQRSGWRSLRGGQAYVCPFLVCPNDSRDGVCSGELHWLESDRRRGTERLVCATCGCVVGPDELALSRRSMQQAPPDIVFTTTEMLNRSLCDDWSSHIFGVGPNARVRPRLVLMDEAHTYAGTSGAQAAFVLRRWRHLVASPVMWVGLSATLRDAEQFFARLTGVPVERVREITPGVDDLESMGHEYQLLLRGDPASQSALLSTSIQTLMLLLRVLDPLGSSPSLGAFGHKVFAFCDNLDLTNRLYRQLLDAEGRNPIGKVNPKRSGSLALLRSETHHPRNADVQDWLARDANGQNWWLVDQLRSSPVPPIVGRTSSQDTGVDANAELVVATSSLEVGYDDPSVGAVLQHKAPRDLAQFLQRRGRAGRSQQMRPWTVVVLSDYGRDRLAYQSYERLFDPLLPPKTLPLGNRSVQRIQATFAVIDWVALTLRKKNDNMRSWRNAFAVPLERDADRTRQAEAAALLAEVLHNPVVRRRLHHHLQRSLGLTPSEVDAVLWEGPRSVLLEALPTAVRRMESDWHRVRNGTPVPRGDRAQSDSPLPEFLPPTLFSDLALPEVEVISPQGYDQAANTEEGAFQVLRELAPGRVTLRWAVQKTKGLWVDPGLGGALEVADTLTRDSDVIAEVEDEHGSRIPVHRPFTISPSVVPPEVGTTSKGQLDWVARVTPVHNPQAADIPDPNPWSAVIDSVAFHLQAGLGGVRLLRYASGGSADVRRTNKPSSQHRYHFVHHGTPIAIGVELEVDAVRIRVRPPADVEGFELERDQRRIRQLRRDFVMHHAEQEIGSLDGLNPFLAGWLAELLMTAIATDDREMPESPTPGSWTPTEWHSRLLAAFDSAFRSLHSDSMDVDDQPPLRDAVSEVLDRNDVRTSLADIWSRAISGPNDAWYPWLRKRFVSTVAAAVHAAIGATLPDFDADASLAVDIIDATDDDACDLWISDLVVGGGGLVEAVYGTYTEDPRRFWQLAQSSLEAQDLEAAAESLVTAIRHIAHGAVSNHAAAYRGARSARAAMQEWRNLLGALARCGVPTSHAFTVALSSRVMRPGSSPSSDAALRAAIEIWEQYEERLGFAVDPRTASALLANDPLVTAHLNTIASAGTSDLGEDWAFSALLGLLWTPAEALRASSLQAPRPFAGTQYASERTLLLDRLDTTVPSVSLSSATWRAEFDALLRSTGRCAIEAQPGEEADLQRAIVDVMTSPTDVGSLLLHPRAAKHTKSVEGIRVLFELTEAHQ